MVSLRPQILSCSLLVEVPMLVHFQSAIQVWAEHRNVSAHTHNWKGPFPGVSFPGCPLDSLAPRGSFSWCSS